MDVTPAGVNHLDVDQLAAVIKNRINKVLIIDSRSFLEFNTCHIVSAVNVCCSKIVKRRLQQGKVTVKDFLVHTCQIEADESLDIVVYDQGSGDASSLPVDSFIFVLLSKLSEVFKSLSLLKGGFLEFQNNHPSLCEDKTRKCAPMTSLSQPCMPISNMGPTKILPFLFLGSQNDAMNKELLKNHNITYELNVSNNCPQPDFLQDHHFMRIAVNDNYSEKLLPHFPKAFQFLDKARESNACVLIHCLAGISRSPTVAIAYVMRHLHMTSDEAYRYVKSKRATISPNFNFLGQLLEYERQLEQENILLLQQQQQQSGSTITSTTTTSGRFQFDATPPFVNGFKRQCCTDMRSGLSHSRSLNLKLPLDNGFSSQLFATAAAVAASSSSPSGGDLSPTSGIAKLSFACRETTTCSNDQLSATTPPSGMSDSAVDRKLKCLKSKLLYLSSLKEESISRSTSTPDSGSPISPTLPSPPAAVTRNPLTPTRPTSLSPVATLTSPCFPSHDFATNVSAGSGSSVSSSNNKKEVVLLDSGGGSTVMWRSCEKRPYCDGGLFAGADFSESLTSSMCTTASGSSMVSSWDYSRSDSTSGIGSEASMMAESTEIIATSESKPMVVGSRCLMVDNENVVLRKPLPACLSKLGSFAGGFADSPSPLREDGSVSAGVWQFGNRLNRDSGNPLSPSDPKCDSSVVTGTGRPESANNLPFDCWDRDTQTVNTKDRSDRSDSGILSPTWSVQNSVEYAARWDRQLSSSSSVDEDKPPSQARTPPSQDSPRTTTTTEGSTRYSVPVSTTAITSSTTTVDDRRRYHSTTSSTTSSAMWRDTTNTFTERETTVLGHRCRYRNQIESVKSSATTGSSAINNSTFFSIPRLSSTAPHNSKCPPGVVSGGSGGDRKEDGLYRAQSCPGIVARFQCAADGAAGLKAAVAFLTSSCGGSRATPLRQLSPTSSPSARADKFRNRYSCGSLDYSDLERIVFDSCPDFAHFGRCQSSGAIAASGAVGGSGGSGSSDRGSGANAAAPLTPTHRNFAGRSVSIIQVS